MDSAARKQARMAKYAATRAKMRANTDATNARRAARGLKPLRYGKIASRMAGGGDVKKMQVGGDIAARRAAADAKRPPSERLLASRKRNDEARARIAASRERLAAMKQRMAARRASRGGMKSGGDVKKMSSGGALYRKSADGIATKGKTRGMEVRMAKGGKC